MMLLERVERVTDSSAVCSVTVDGHGVLAPFLNVDGDLPGWFALELMAQTVGVWSEWHRLQKACPTARWAWCWRARAGVQHGPLCCRHYVNHYH